MNGLDGRHSWDGNERSRIPGDTTFTPPQVGTPQPGDEESSDRPRPSFNFASNAKVLWETYFFPADLFHPGRWFAKSESNANSPDNTTRTNNDKDLALRNWFQKMPIIVKKARAILARDPAMKTWYKTIKTIPIQSTPNLRSKELYKAVIEQFDVERKKVKRYQKVILKDGKSQTYCNIFAQDVMRAMGVPLPPKCAKDLLEYLSDTSLNHGWQLTDPFEPGNLQSIVGWLQQGHPMLVFAGDHVAVLRPDQPNNIKSIWDLHIAQAGGKNYSSTTLSYGWDRHKSPRFSFFYYKDPS